MHLISALLYLIKDNYAKSYENAFDIAINLTFLMGSIAWFIVHCLMLKIFTTYGKPLEDDQKTLI